MAGSGAPSRNDPATLVERMLAGDRLALARLITLVENRAPAVSAIMRAVHGRGTEAYVVGVTGPPGAGKSTIVDRITALVRARDESVGVVAVDPSSPFTGGAVLGDRIRMQAHALDPGVFIRSMATRGAFGGLARASGDVLKLLAAFGLRFILIETVGVGQTELDIMKLADTTVVVLVPESGDAIQTMKAGLLEAADVFVVNKADRSGADALAAELRFAAHLQYSSPSAPRDIDWEIPVLATQAQANIGVAEVLDAIDRHRATLEAAGALDDRRRARRRQEFRSLLVERLTASVERAARRRRSRRDVPAGRRGHARSLRRGRASTGRAIVEILMSPDVPFRDTFWNVPVWAQLVLYVAASVAIGVFAYGMWKRVALWRAGKPEHRLDQLPQRVALVARHALGQARTLGQAYPGIMHAIMFWGFLALFLGTVLATIDYDITLPLFDYKLLKGPFYLFYETTLDLFGPVLRDRARHGGVATLRASAAPRSIPPRTSPAYWRCSS